VNLLILVVDDEPDVEVLFRQHFRRDLRAGRFAMEFAQSAPAALQRIADAAGVSLILLLSGLSGDAPSGSVGVPVTGGHTATHPLDAVGTIRIGPALAAALEVQA
jgi:CheY-like chemotaxis protein